MQQSLKQVSKKCSLFILGCLLLSMSLVGWQQHAATAHADTTFDLYVWTSLNQVWGHNIGDSGNGVLLDNGHTGVFTSSGCCDISSAFGPITAVIARGTDVWEQRGRFLFQLAPGTFCSSVFGYTGWCLTEIDDNPATTMVAAGGNGQLYQLHTTGSLWQYNGCGYHCWSELDDDPLTNMITAGAGKLFQERTNGTVWKYMGCGFHCWEEIDARPNITELILDTTGTLYELVQTFDSNGHLASASVLQGFGPFNWQTIDFSTSNVTLQLLTNSRLYEEHSDRSVTIYNEGIGWAAFDVGLGLTTIATGANSDALYKQLGDNSIWGRTPLSQNVLVSPPVSGQIVSMSAPTNG